MFPFVQINSIWDQIYQSNFLQNLLNKAKSCERSYGHYQYNIDSDVSVVNVFVLLIQLKNLFCPSSSDLVRRRCILLSCSSNLANLSQGVATTDHQH